MGTYRLDEILALFNYLNKTMSVESAARAITARDPNAYSDWETFVEDIDQDSSNRFNKLWGLLATLLLRFEDDGDMVIDLLVAIQTLPSVNSTPWWVDAEDSRSLCELPYFDDIWQDCYESLRCQCREGQDGGFGTDKKYYKRAGTAEAKMYLRGIPGITEFWAYRTINLICLQKDDLEFVIHEIHGWLQTAGPKLAETLDSNQIKSFERAVRGRPDKRYEISATMFEHWQHWKKSFLEVSFDEHLLSVEGRGLARECHDIMKAQNIKLPLFL
ncbi:hypothetical protein FPHYL_1160 [Fusarium phyllophilum]|uniref:Uncharacterized protein n=1 Tax=Fusarium phyllophilum TaxID=47803 RepID=A0A8H5KBX2_9HYPO|nr:hypothetical protein FPHYL_1160 [Fusarium phyllophilum]